MTSTGRLGWCGGDGVGSARTVYLSLLLSVSTISTKKTYPAQIATRKWIETVAAKDIFHDAVKNALEKEGWSITHDPLFLQVGGVEMYIDLGAEKLIAAEKDDQKIAVEIKSFVNVSAIYDFHLAIGQYRNYLLALSKEDPERRLYLAVPEDVFDRFFVLQFIQEALVYNDVNYMVYDVTEEVIVQWQK